MHFSTPAFRVGALIDIAHVAGEQRRTLFYAETDAGPRNKTTTLIM
jgi:hypothetical protein